MFNFLSREKQNFHTAKVSQAIFFHVPQKNESVLEPYEGYKR